MICSTKLASRVNISKSSSTRKVCLLQHLHAAVASYSTAADSDFLHKSKLPSDHFQPSLPRLKIPALEKTCERYLAAQRPILSEADLKKTEAIVNKFKDGEGKVLHDDLVSLDKKNKHTSFISAPWSDMYLKDRRAVALNHNPFMAMIDDPKSGYNNQLVRATNITMSSLRFMRTLRAGVLDPEVFHLNPPKSDTDSFRNILRFFPKSLSWYGAYLYKAFPLDMSQFPWLFNTNRIPLWEKDELVTDPNASNLLVLHNGHLYTFECLTPEGRIKPAKEIMGYLSEIINNPAAPAAHPVGIMTSQPRDVWTAVREKLVAAGNEELLSKVDKAYFALVLDSDTTAEPTAMSRRFLHSDGTNRWFDKCFSLLMDSAGQTAVNFEHSWGDGVAVLRYFNEVFKDSTEKPHVHPDTVPNSTQGVTRLDFKLTDELMSDIDQAKANFKKTTAGLDLNYVEFKKFGKSLIKKKKVSPDSFMQLAIQLAFYRQYGKFVGTYESCSTSAFKHGRTETVRSCTSATRKACELFEQAGTRPSVSELQAAIDECSKVHNQLTKEAAMGEGFDRHLFAMRYYAEWAGHTPEIFQDPNYKMLNHIILSTSTLASPALKIGGFAAVVPDGYGIGYGIQDEKLGFIVTGYPPNRDVNGFLATSESSLNDMASVLDGHDFK